MKVTRSVEFYKCNKCRHEWINRTLHEPRICPLCKSVRWNDITGLFFDAFEDADKFLSKNYGPIKWLGDTREGAGYVFSCEDFACLKGKFRLVFCDNHVKIENI